MTLETPVGNRCGRMISKTWGRIGVPRKEDASGLPGVCGTAFTGGRQTFRNPFLSRPVGTVGVAPQGWYISLL